MGLLRQAVAKGYKDAAHMKKDTDLDPILKRHAVERVTVIGLRANTCIDSTVRYAAELCSCTLSCRAASRPRRAASLLARWRTRR